MDGDTQDYPAQPAFEIAAASVVQAGSNPARSVFLEDETMSSGSKGKNEFSKDDRVVIAADGDGGLGSAGRINKVFRSGRCLVYLDNGDIRNILPGNLVHEVSDR